MRLGLGLGIGRRRGGGGGPSYDAEAASYFGWSGVSDPTYMALQNTLIVALKAATGETSLADAFDCLWIFGNQDDSGAAALFNVVKNDHHCENINGCAYDAAQGFTGNASNRYLKTNYTPSTDAVVYQQNNASILGYARLAATSGNRDLWGGRDGSNLGNEFQPTYGSVAGLRFNSASFAGGPANDTTQGLFILNRTGSGASHGALWWNGNKRTGGIQGSSGLPPVEQFLLALNNNGSPAQHSANQLGAAGFGRAFTDGEIAGINAAIEAYFDDLGTGIQ